MSSISELINEMALAFLLLMASTALLQAFRYRQYFQQKAHPSFQLRNDTNLHPLSWQISDAVVVNDNAVSIHETCKSET